MIGGTPIFILKEGTERESGKRAQSKNIAAARAIADAVRTIRGLHIGSIQSKHRVLKCIA